MGSLANLKSYWITVGALNILLLAAGIVYADVKQIPGAVAVPIVAAFLVQATLYLIPGFPAVRRMLEERLSAKRLAAAWAAASLAPYLIYSIPLGLFAWLSLIKLAAVTGVAAFLFVLFPVGHRDRLAWQDVLLLALLVSPMISGLTPLFDEIFTSPGEPVPALDILGKLMVIPLGATAFLSLRGIEGADFRFQLTRRDLRVGFKRYIYYLPIGLPLALALGFVRFDPTPIDGWSYPLNVAGKVVGIYLVTALSEELCFRGIILRLVAGSSGSDRLAQAVSAVLFGAVHISSRGFPNWGYAISAAVAGWFYADAYREGRGVVPAAVTHTLVVVTAAFLFR